MKKLRRGGKGVALLALVLQRGGVACRGGRRFSWNFLHEKLTHVRDTCNRKTPLKELLQLMLKATKEDLS